jgi:O-antigen ligase
MVGALAIHAKDKKKAAFFILVLLCSYVAIRISCSRAALMSAASLSVMMFFAFRKLFGKALTAIIVAIILLGSVTILMDKDIRIRIKHMFDFSGTVDSNEKRFLLWKNGIEVFKEHPVLGVGPDAIPNVECSMLPESERDCANHNPYFGAHQLFINALAESGVVGLFGFLALHLLPLYYLRKGIISSDPEIRFWVWSALVVFFQLVLNGLVDHVFGLKPRLYIYWTVTAIAYWVISQSEKKSREIGSSPQVGNP